VRPYYFDFDAPRTWRALAILNFERMARGSVPPRPRRRRRQRLRAAAALLGCWVARRRERRELARLDLRMLRDIGVTPSEAAGEADKPFWRA